MVDVPQPPLTPTPFHAGELQAQEKAGTRGVAAELSAGIGSRHNFSRNHDAFLAAQSFAVVSSVAPKDDRVWVTPLFGSPGVMAVSETRLKISEASIPENDVLRSVIEKVAEGFQGTHLSFLGIDLLHRTRHRINGVLVAAPAESRSDLHFEVREYSPNCPKYINRRELVPASGGNDNPVINRDAVRQERTALNESDKDFVLRMDMLWIGSVAPGVGADANHHGGKPGFVRVVSDGVIEWPEYRGNGMFYTSGNLEVDNRAGVTFVDFETGSMIQLTGRANVDWDHDGSYDGATRKVHFEIEKLIRSDNVTNHRWKRLDYSPYNPSVSGLDKCDTGSTGGVSEFPVTVTLAKIVQESSNVKTFRWVAERAIPFLPGQYATFNFNNVPGGSNSEVRTWTLSETPNSVNGDNTLDITVKRKGMFTNWLHDQAEVGLTAEFNGVQGYMTAVKTQPPGSRKLRRTPQKCAK